MGFNFKPASDARNVIDRDVAFGPFDPAEISAIDAALVGQRLLAQTTLRSKATHILRQNVPQRSFVSLFHKRDFGPVTLLRRPLLSYIRRRSLLMWTLRPAVNGATLPILSCPGCHHRLRVPDRKRGTVTCPLCGSEWFHPETIELSRVEFRCSASGAKFDVVSSRRSPLHKFSVQRVEKTVATTPNTDAPRQPLEKRGPRPPLPALPPAGPRGWLARIIGRNTHLAVPPPKRDEPDDRTTNTAISATTNDADEYNWSGFSCPYCNAAGFVACQGGHLSCKGTVQVRSGRDFHQCFCGHAGIISGTIKTFKNERLAVEPGAETSNPPPGDRPQERHAQAVVLPNARPVPAKR
jgi:hypothetical protein